jgi:hypothetical protein
MSSFLIYSKCSGGQIKSASLLEAVGQEVDWVMSWRGQGSGRTISGDRSRALSVHFRGLISSQVGPCQEARSRLRNQLGPCYQARSTVWLENSRRLCQESGRIMPWGDVKRKVGSCHGAIDQDQDGPCESDGPNQ